MATLRAPGIRDTSLETLSPGVREAFGERARVKQAVRIEAARGEAEAVALEDVDPQADVLELTLEGGIRQYIRLDAFREDYGVEPARGAGDELFVPARLGHRERSRGLKGDAALKTLRVIGVPAERMLARAVAERLEGKLAAGLHRWPGGALGPETLVERESLASGDPLLIFLHGTASSTLGSFGALPGKHPEIWDELAKEYPERILAFEHGSLSKSPIQNVIELLEVLPVGAELHLVSHSRGGLLGELLCRAQTLSRDGQARAPFDDKDLRQLDGRDYEQQRALLEQLGELLGQKQPRVTRFVRVACPASGTLLASKRLDRFFSLLVNVVGKAGLEASFLYDFVTSLAMATARERTNPKTLPGIEAMVPDSPLVKVLNRPDVRSKADLSVIAGDIEGSGFWQRLKVFATDLFYWEDHDLVVHTRAMYGGSPRADGGARFHFDKGSDVSHFNYFKNEETARKLRDGLRRADGTDGGFREFSVKQPPASRSAPVGPAEAVAFVLPGIMGSHLGVGDDRIWIDPAELALGGLAKLAVGRDEKPDIEPLSLVGLAYADLVSFLRDRRYEVIAFPFDWRLSLLEEAKRLAEAVHAKLESTDLRVGLVAHSMGGLLARAMIAQRPSVWERIKARDGRLVMLGTPNQGSHVIPNVVLGRERMLRNLARIDFVHDRRQVLDIVRRFPGLLEMLPAGEERDYFSPEAWRELHLAHGLGWTPPEAADLAAAARLQQTLDGAAIDPEHMSYVAGKAPATPVEIRVEEGESGPERIRVLATEEGDGRVPWSTGILPGVGTWYVNATHGSLAAHVPAFPAILELLEQGDTRRLPSSPPVARGSTERFEAPPDEPPVFPDQEELEASALGFGPTVEREELRVPIRVSIQHGDLRFARNPVVIGHYEGDAIVGAEAELDRALGGRLRIRRQLGQYPARIGTSSVVLDASAKPPGAIVVGLGRIGRLTPGDLRRTIARGLRGYVLERFERDGEQGLNDLAVTCLLVGSGDGGVSIQDAVLAALDAAHEANLSLEETELAERARIGAVELLEVHLDRAVQTSKFVRQLADDPQRRDRFDLSRWRVNSMRGGLRRIAREPDLDWWGRLQITESRDDVRALRFVALTERARAETFMLGTQRAVVDAFLRDAVGTTAANEQLSKTLFELLLPNPLKDAAPQDRDLVLIVDEGSARYPWELLQDPAQPDSEPIAVRAGLVRQMETEAFREEVRSATERRALVVGDPPTTTFASLPGAEAEAKQVRELLRHAGFSVEDAIGKGFREVLSKLFDRPAYRVLHVAAHGVYEHEIVDPEPSPEGGPEPGRERRKRKVTGVVLGDGAFLTPGEINQMRIVPELAFINCCHLGRAEGRRPAGAEGRFPELAANIGTQLIQMGCHAVVVAGWAVQDAAAKTFAEVFYGRLLAGESFGEAVKKARGATWHGEKGYNTWGAYQCYGDPDYVLVPRGAHRGEREKPVLAVIEEALLELGNVTEEARKVSLYRQEPLRHRLDELEEAVDPAWRGDARLLAALGAAHGELGSFERAVAYYDEARRCEEGTLSVRNLEQLANLRCRWAVELWRSRNEKRERDPAEKIEKATPERDPAEVIGEAITDLEVVLGVGKTGERLALLASAYKRLAWLSRGADRDEALRKMRKAYREATELGLEREGAPDLYPALNWVTAEALLRLRHVDREPGPVDEVLVQIEASLGADGKEDSFWDEVAIPDAELARRLYQGDLDRQDHRVRIAEGYAAARALGSAREFGSVLEHLEFLAEVLAEECPDPERRERLQRGVGELLDGLRSLGV